MKRKVRSIFESDADDYIDSDSLEDIDFNDNDAGNFTTESEDVTTSAKLSDDKLHLECMKIAVSAAKLVDNPDLIGIAKNIYDFVINYKGSSAQSE